jgi:acyl carrier protein
MQGMSMVQRVSAPEVLEMIREEGLVDIDADFPVEGDLFEAGMDSMAVMQLIVIIEERFGVVLGPEDVSRDLIGTAERLAELISTRLK